MYVDFTIYYHAQHFLPSTLYQRLAVIPENNPLEKGYYFLDPVDTSLPRDRFIEITSLKRRLRVALDWRIANQFRNMKKSPLLAKYLMREVLVYEKE